MKKAHFNNRLGVRDKPNNHVLSAYTWSLVPRRKISLLLRVTSFTAHCRQHSTRKLTPGTIDNGDLSMHKNADMD